MTQNHSKNPLVMGKTSSERSQNLFDRLTQPAIQNSSPNYNLPVSPGLSQSNKQLIVVTLDKLRPYEGNPRRTQNPAFDEIKASIKARGLDHAPNVTQRPGDDFYMIADGGNTRLQALNELFKETQEMRFWSIECIFKPWQGNADDINAQLNILIGHLAENDVRGDLTFIEKALGIRDVKALYEKKYSEYFSHRKLAEKLAENGYPISNQLLSRMEQCLTYLYPHIPNILFSGIGKSQIDKLIGIHNKAKISWDKYQAQYPTELGLDDIWMSTLSPFDEDVANFSINEFQDSLIGKMIEALNYQVSYDALKLEIDLEERKLQKLVEKQAEIQQRAVESEQHIQEHQEQLDKKGINSPQKKAEAAAHHVEADLPQLTEPTITDGDISDLDIPEQDVTNPILPNLGLNTNSNEMEQAMSHHFSGLGIMPESARQEEAVINGLEFANTGRQPITNLWKTYPNRQHKMDAYSIALDIAEECGLDHLVQHIVTEPVDYRFNLLPLDIESPSPLILVIYNLLSILATDQLAHPVPEISISLTPNLLLSSQTASAEISDLMLVRLFRLIRLVRHLREEYRQGEYHA